MVRAVGAVPERGQRQVPGTSTVLVTVLVALWPLLLTLLLTWPLVSGTGYPLARDLVFVPDQPLTRASLGLGDVAPRAVPLDAVVSLLSLVADGAVWARVLVPGALVAAGWGMQRCLAGAHPLAQLAASGVAVWNPWTVERLALGQWALLAGFAGSIWLVAGLLRWRDRRSRSDVVVVLVAAAVASLTPTGGLFALAVALVLLVGRPLRDQWPLAVVAVLQAPWVLAGFLGPAARTSDPDGVAAFAARADGTGSAVLSLLGLGGIWDSTATPGSRETPWVWLAVLWVLGTLAATWWWQRRDRRAGGENSRPATEFLPPVGVVVLAVAGTVLAALSVLPGGEALLRAVVTHVPGGGLLRDAQKFLAPLVLLVAWSTGWLLERVRHSRLWDPVLWSPVLLVPLLVLPDATGSAWPTVRPVTYPSAFDEVGEQVAGDPDCRMLTLPLRSYRGFSWGSGRSSSDPASRWFDCEVVVDDRLVVGESVIAGESALVAQLVADRDAGRSWARVAADAGIGWVLVYEDDPEAADLDLTGLTPVLRAKEMSLYRVRT